MTRFLVWHQHQLIGDHDERCEQLLQPDQKLLDVPFHRRHENNDLVISEAGAETRYLDGTWSAAGLDLPCGFLVPANTSVRLAARGCPRCDADTAKAAKEQK